MATLLRLGSLWIASTNGILPRNPYFKAFRPRLLSKMSVLESSSQNVFENLLSKHRIFVLDGGTGEELFRRGVPDDRKIWSATALVHDNYHSVLKQVHQSFVDAGAQAITTNSYGVVPGVGFTEQEIDRYGQLAGQIARQVVSEVSTPRVAVLGSLGPLVESYRADLIMKHEYGVRAYVRMIHALSPHVDAFVAETMSCVSESMQAIEALGMAKENKPCLVSYTLDSSGRLRDGERVRQGIPRLLDFASRHRIRVPAIMFNCAEPEAITQALEEVRQDSALVQQLEESNIRLGAYANRLTPVASTWTLAESTAPQPMRSDMDPEQYDRIVSRWVSELGVTIVGGCCGTTPEHIKILSNHFKSSK